MQTFLVAARQPLALAVLLTAIVAGLTVALWLLPLGLLVYAIVVLLAGRDPATAAAASQQARRAARPQLTSRTFRAIVNKIDRAQQEVARSVAQAPPPLATLLQSVTQQTHDLVEQAHLLASKGQVIEAYLTALNYRQIQDQLNQIDAQIARTQDSYTLQQLRETRTALVDRQSNAQALETYIGRITAQLQNIDANLDNVLAETVRLRTADVVSADSMSNDVAQRLRDLNTDMDTFQRVLDTALVQSGAQTI